MPRSTMHLSLHLVTLQRHEGRRGRRLGDEWQAWAQVGAVVGTADDGAQGGGWVPDGAGGCTLRSSHRCMQGGDGCQLCIG